jgi:prepilin-type N-terminal cleavage/methylation domain-containing protein
MKINISSTSGVTLIEMLIVILILGLLIVVGYRTIDATNYESRFSKTSKQMIEIIKGFVGNPDLVSDGRRISFGYVGDMGRLPDSIGALITPENGNWKGPYLPNQFVEDKISYKTDAWGDTYHYDKQNAFIRSNGGGKQIMTMKIADTIINLFNNSVSGTITDINSAPPVELSSRISVRLTVPDVAGQSGNLIDYSVNPGQDGYYEFTSTNDMPVPIGYHRLVVTKLFGTTDSIARWISVSPRSNIITDFRFPYSFRSSLKYVEGSGAAPGDTNIGFSVFNSGDTVTLDSMVLIYCDSTAYFEEVRMNDNIIWQYSTTRAGVGYLVEFTTIPLPIPPNSIVRFDIRNFMDNPTSGSAHSVNMSNNHIAIRFSDGSIIDFRL